MKIGMLWRMPNTTKPIAEKIIEAGVYYQKKYGKFPDLCHMSHKDLANIDGSDTIQIGTGENATMIYLRPMATLYPNHLWIGVEDEK